MMIYIGGIPGVGKTSIINNLILELNKLENKSKMIQGLPVLRKLAGGISSDEFRKLPDEIREKYRPEMWKIIYEEDRQDFDTIRILDGHFIYFESNGINFSKRKINPEDYIHIKAIFVINSKPEDILKRRQKDISERFDRSLDMEIIKKQLDLEIKEAISQSKEIGVPIFVIDNNKEIKEISNEIYIEFKKIFKLPNENNEIKFNNIKIS